MIGFRILDYGSYMCVCVFFLGGGEGGASGGVLLSP